MGLIRWFLFVYVFGGLTFVPLLVGLVLLYAYHTLPPAADRSSINADDPAQIARENDEKLILKSGTDDLAEKFQRRHESDVASGYFAVCREYVPGGVNGKPPDKLSPAGEVVAIESPSIYQNMYRSIFDRSQKPTIEPNKDSAGKAVKRANNVFYVVLRHGHLMLYDDIQQLDVRYVISLEYHDVDIYGGTGTEDIAEGELWVKRNAIRLKRKQTQGIGKKTSLPFFLFGENLSEKEDFYFALLKNQEKNDDDTPVPQEFEVRHIVNLVQKLHSSEEHLQTRWLNAFIGRMFLAMYKTPGLEQFIRAKLTKKISRVKKPTFITKLVLQKIEMGSGGPFITNPRLKDLTVNGDCVAEADVDYTGNFRIEIAATAQIDLGARFKKREVDMILAATVKKVQGHALIRIKPPPSNRFWFTFEKPPQIDLALEPIVSSRQITYNLILRAIESRIREVIAETIVLPFWDDIPFLDTVGERHRGGIWKKENVGATSTEIADEDPEDEAEAGSSGTRTPIEFLKNTKDERIMSMPALADSKRTSADRKSISSMNEILGSSGDRTSPLQPPRVLRSTSFASAANPMVTANHVDGDALGKDVEPAQKRDSAAAFLKDLSARSANQSPTGSPQAESSMAAAMAARSATLASKASTESLKLVDDGQPTTLASGQASLSTTPTASTASSRPPSVHEDPKPSRKLAQSARSLTTTDRKQAMANISAATAAAQKWGWGVLARNRQKDGHPPENPSESSSAARTPSVPMGRGHPLPPPGTPLPPPPKPLTLPNPFSIPKRKSVPPPLLPKRPSEMNGAGGKASSKPALPERRNRQSSMRNDDDHADEVMIVEAPEESAPTSPASDMHHDEFFGHSEASDVGVGADEAASITSRNKPPLPRREPSDETDESMRRMRMSPDLDEAVRKERTLSMEEMNAWS